MRDIKFKAHIKTLDWVVQVSAINFDIKTVEVDLTGGQGDAYEYDFNEVDLMQFTGMHDETDEETEVYEEDIIKFKHEGKEYTGTVKFEGGCFMVVSKELADGYLKLINIADCDREYWSINGKVIGNTYCKED